VVSFALASAGLSGLAIFPLLSEGDSALAGVNDVRFFKIDTSGNVVSANNFIRAGYRMYRPPSPWAFPDTLYWRKDIASGPSAHSTHSKRR
jgi:hypothetical protein